MTHVPGIMLSKMLQIVTEAHDSDQILKRGNVLHPIRTMVAMRSDDEELNCIALGHELLNTTHVTLNDLIRSNMSDRVLQGIILLKDTDTLEQTLVNICQTDDTMSVGLACLMDRGAISRDNGVATAVEHYKSYMRIANYMRDIKTCKTLGLKRPFFS